MIIHYLHRDSKPNDPRIFRGETKRETASMNWSVTVYLYNRNVFDEEVM